MRIFTDEHKAKISKSKKGIKLAPRTKAHSDAIALARLGHITPIDTREKISESWAVMEPTECPHCGVSGKGGIMKRWHLDRCKYKRDSYNA